MNEQRKAIFPIIILFLIVNGALIAAKGLLVKYGVDTDVVRIGNLICFLLNIIVLLLQSKSLKNANPNVFIRAVMGGFAIKMLLSMIIVGVYITTAKPVNKPGVYVSLVLYIVYMAVELATILKLNKKKNA
jgi:hypothetical protein